MSETWTILRLLKWTTDYLKQRGSESPRLDAEVLLASAKGCERITLYTAFDEVVSDDLRAKFRDLVKRRAEGVPVAYLVGKKEFYSLPFRVTPEVLIPRPETESAVVAALDGLKTSGLEPMVADIGTGSGAIAVAIARHAPSAHIVAIDISPAALAIAQSNAQEHGVAERIEFREGDLLSPVPAEPTFALIVSNPPYVSETEYAQLSPHVRDHEPRQALVAGPTGAEVIERLIPQAAERLLPGGLLIIEISPMIATRVVELLAADPRLEPATIIKDLSGMARVVRARCKA